MTEIKQFEIPLLTAEDIECRVQSISKSKSGKVGATLLLYKDARVDMRILDQVFGANNWQRTHELINGNLFCNIDIWDDTKKAWIRKQDVGVESNTEKEKGQASDAFKRAGFNVGIGRELYTAPFIYVELEENEYYNEKQGQKEIYKCYPSTKFNVGTVAYNDRREIVELTIVDRKGNVRYSMGKKTKETAPQAQAKQTQQQDKLTCPLCGGPMTDAEKQYSARAYGQEACRVCQKNIFTAKEK